MGLLGMFAWLGGAWLAWASSRPGVGRRTALTVFTVTVLLAGGWAAVLVSTGAEPTEEPLQLGLLVLYFLAYGLVPSALLRYARAPRVAAAVALCLPALMFVVRRGAATEPVRDGLGHAEELLFLDPLEMGEGITRAGRIPHRYRVHWIVLAGAVLAAVLVHALPSPASRREEA